MFIASTCAALARARVWRNASTTPTAPATFAKRSPGYTAATPSRRSWPRAFRAAETSSGLAGVATVGAPIDISACSKLITDYPFYDRFYVRRLKAQVRLHLKHVPDQPDPGLSRIRTLYQFDDHYTVPRGGFADVPDYYDRASSSPWVSKIRVPTFMLTAKDDPFVAWEPYMQLPTMPNLEVHLAPRGGHLGFLGVDGNGGIRWAEAQVLKWILKQASCVRPSVGSPASSTP